MMPLTDGIITSSGAAGTTWGMLATMAMWAYYLAAIAGAPLLVVLEKTTVFGTLKGAISLLIGTIGAVLIIPFADSLATSLLTDFWLFGAQLAMGFGFISAVVVIPLFAMLSEEDEFGEGAPQ